MQKITFSLKRSRLVSDDLLRRIARYRKKNIDSESAQEVREKHVAMLSEHFQKEILNPNCSKERIELFLECGIEPAEFEKAFAEALKYMRSSRHTCDSFIKSLMEVKSDDNINIDYNSILTTSVGHRETDIAKVCLDNGADPNTEYDSMLGTTHPATEAAWRQDLDTLKLLINAGADVNKKTVNNRAIESLKKDGLDDEAEKEAKGQIALEIVVNDVSSTNTDKSIAVSKLLVAEHVYQALNDNGTDKERCCCRIKDILKQNPTIFKAYKSANETASANQSNVLTTNK